MLTVWAALGFASTGEPREILRAGLSLGLTAAMGLAVYRLRPRAGWGVEVSALGVKVSRPRGAGAIELSWNDVTEIRRTGERRDTLAVWLGDQRRVLIPSLLFPRRDAFEAVARALEARMPEQQTALKM